jgi:hypothetical protein
MAFVLVASKGSQEHFYSGRAGEAWVSPIASEAFRMGEGEAARKAELFNGRSVLHGLTFQVREAA